MTINGLSSTVNEREYVNSILKGEHMSTLQLRQEAEDFIRYKFDLGNDTRGKIWRSSYSECGNISKYLRIKNQQSRSTSNYVVLQNIACLTWCLYHENI